MNRFFSFVLAATLALGAALPAGAATISNGPANGNIGTFGNAPRTPTYGQVFTAPITGTLTSFTLSLNGGVGALVGAVGTWNGTAAYGAGFGSPTTLYNSGRVVATTAGPYTFAPNIAVTAGERYVAFLTTWGVAGATGFTSMPRVTVDTPGINYFVWNNGGSPFGDASWNYFANFGDVLFSATFTPPATVPLPPAVLLLLAALAGLGALAKTRKKAMSEPV